MIAAGPRRLASLGLVAALLTACSPPRPCAASHVRLATRMSRPYVGRWRVARGDTVTLPEMGDRFKLTELILDTGHVETGKTCRFAGALVFTAPRAETLSVRWIGEPQQAFIYGWPADLGPFGGLSVSRSGDSLRGALLFDARLGIRVKPGLTAQFMASRIAAQ